MPPEPLEAEGFENTLLSGETPAGSFIFDTKLYQAQLDPAGGIFTEWALAQYTDWRDLPVDMVGNAKVGLFDLALTSSAGRANLSGTEFAASRFSDQDGDGVVLRARPPQGWTVEIRYTFLKDRYCSRMGIKVDGFPNPKGDAEIVLTFPEGLPRFEKIAKQDEQAGASLAMVGKHLVKQRQWGRRPGWRDVEQGVIRWVGIRSKYFLAALIPEGSPDGVVEMGCQERNVVTTSLHLPLALNGPSHFEFQVFAGPMKHSLLETYGVELEKSVDFGWKVILPFSRLLLGFMNFLHQVIPNYGVVILIISVLTKVIFYPLTKKSMQSMKGLQALKPEIDKLNEKYKDDPQRKNQAMFELYKKHKVNPMGGCLPIVIQMPVFVALYSVLRSAIELRKQPFVLWVDDLSAPDKVGSLFGMPVHVLPLLMAVTMFVQQRLTPTDPRQAAIGYVMPVMMLVFFYTLPSGLVFYWTVNNLLQVGQQLILNREAKQQLAAA